MSEWISVEDRFPKDDELVIVWYEADGHSHVSFDYRDEDLWGDWFNGAEHANIAGGCVPEDAPYTHWMPLPEPPNA
jgi:hypothetical protein